MAFCDFVVKYDPEKDTSLDLTKRILYSVIIKRIKAKKPVRWFIGGGSGEGKSYTALRLQELLLGIQGIEAEPYIDSMNCYTPLQYPQKLEALLFNKELKKINIIAMHEARSVIKAKMWQSFLPQAVGDINAMSRTVKRLIILIISQFIRDITTDIRYTLDFYSIVRRPKNKPARLYINIMWKDDRDLEKPKLRKRKLSGYLVYPNGRRRRFVPQYFEMSKPSKESIELFEKQDYQAKAGIIKKKMTELINEMKADVGELTSKVDGMVEWYIKNPEAIYMIGRKYRGKWKLNKQVIEMHDLNKEEVKIFETRLNEHLKEQGVIIEQE